MYQLPRMNTRIAKRLVQKKKLLDEYRPLPPFTVQRLHEDLRVLLTYHSNAIEGTPYRWQKRRWFLSMMPNHEKTTETSMIYCHLREALLARRACF